MTASRRSLAAAYPGARVPPALDERGEGQPSAGLAQRGGLLLELLSEEIPAQMQPRAIAELVGLLRDKLAAADLPAASLRGYVTPRRLTVVAEGLPASQPDRSEERRGPRVGAPPPAIEGFLRSMGIVSVEECEVRDTGRGEFYFAVLKRPGRSAADVLPDLLKSAIAELPWPKSMRYPASSLRWVRPLTSVVCLLDGEVLALPLDRIPVGRTTRGHRHLSPGEICVGDAGEYLECLDKAHVILDLDRRKEMIREGLAYAAAAEGLTLKPDAWLLDEVTGLVEFPVVLGGTIDADFMTLPPEVLTAAMRTHQRYFSCLQPDGTPASRFLFVADNLAADGGKMIVAGNERVLRARLADARFFWDQDRRVPLASRVGALSERVFHAKLGSLHDKVGRMERLAEFLAPYVRGADAARSQRAVLLAKADLSSGMVGEFPELQGIMGRYYALHDREHPAVAEAIAEHYRPLGPNDACPTEPDSIVAALADKIDTLAAFFAIGEAPTGSRDPFALRRAALGVIRLIVENGLRLSLACAFAHAIMLLGGKAPSRGEARGAAKDALLAFFSDRLKVHLRGAGVRHDLIAAAFTQIGHAEDDLVRLLQRVDALQNFLHTDDGASLLTAYRRASNIVTLEERRDGRHYDEDGDPALYRQAEEAALASKLAEVGGQAGELLIGERFQDAMIAFVSLRRPIDEFFDKVTVNVDDKNLRENRLRLLSRIRVTMNQVADFSQIEG